MSNQDDEVEQLRKPSVSAPIPIQASRSGITNLILPSLSKANTAAHTPSGSPPLGKITKGDAGLAEQFFYNARKPSNEVLLADQLNERLGPHLIQPKSRYNPRIVPSLVIEAKKKIEDVGLSGLKINRSQSNLAAMPGVLLRSGSFSADYLPSTQRLRQFTGFTLNNDSSSSLTITEEEAPESKRKLSSAPETLEPFDEEMADMINNGERLAPYGGFSRPDLEATFMNDNNVFDLAPWKVVKSEAGNGSLVNAVNLASESKIVSKVKWVGTMSLPSDEIPERVLKNIAEKLHDEYNSESVIVNDITFQGHYMSFCKQILWPTLHYQIPDDPKSKAFEEHSYHHYKLLNQLVADKLVETYKRENGHLDPQDPENIIWVHDYHLLLVPAMVREKLPDAKIGFFLHVSFPSSEVFRCLAQRKSLLKGLLAADCITFQTDEYVRHFLQTCTRLLLADTNEYGVVHEGQFTMVNTIPVGIDGTSLAQVLRSDDVVEWKLMIRERWGDQILIVSRDKLDKLRGVKQRLLAYEEFLTENPEYIESAVLIQIFMGTSHDEDYETEVMQIISRINSMADNISVVQPVEILHRDIQFDQYLALQSEAEVFIVSSMREGLNLTCHEFIVASTDKKSPLILSEFTGSSQLLSCDGKGALLINPWDKRAFSNTIKTALTMLAKEKRERWENCHDIVMKHDSMDWIKNCLASISEAWFIDHEKSALCVNPFTKGVFEQFCNAATDKKLFFINLDNPTTFNALLGGASRPSKGYIELSRVGSILIDLLSDSSNSVYVVSILKRSELDSIFKNVSNLGLVAESGGFIKLIGQSKWLSIIDENEVGNWMPQVVDLIQSKAERLPGSSAVVEECTVRLLAEIAMKEDVKRALDIMGDCIQHINDVFEETEGVHATLINNSVVVQQKNISLKALKFLLACYTTDVSTDALVEQYQIKRVSSSTDATLVQELPAVRHVLESSEFNANALKKSTTLFYAGGLNPTDEAIYDYVNTLEKDDVVRAAITVAVRGSEASVRTFATYSVLGQNELFGVLSRR